MDADTDALYERIIAALSHSDLGPAVRSLRLEHKQALDDNHDLHWALSRLQGPCAALRTAEGGHISNVATTSRVSSKYTVLFAGLGEGTIDHRTPRHPLDFEIHAVDSRSSTDRPAYH